MSIRDLPSSVVRAQAKSTSRPVRCKKPHLTVLGSEHSYKNIPSAAPAAKDDHRFAARTGALGFGGEVEPRSQPPLPVCVFLPS